MITRTILLSSLALFLVAASVQWYGKAQTLNPRIITPTPDDEISNLISVIITDEIRKNEPEKVVNSIRRLGELRAVEAVPALVSILTFKVQPIGESRNDLFVIEYHTINNADRYPAMQALFEIGDESLPALFSILETEDCDSLTNILAFETIKSIYLKDDIRKAPEVFKARVTNARTVAARQCLESGLKKIQITISKLDRLNPDHDM